MGEIIDKSKGKIKQAAGDLTANKSSSENWRMAGTDLSKPWAGGHE